MPEKNGYPTMILYSEWSVCVGIMDPNRVSRDRVSAWVKAQCKDENSGGLKHN